MSSRLVRVTWTDSGMARSEGWEDRSRILERMDHHDALKVATVGFLFHEDEDHLFLAQSYDKFNDQYLNAQMIWRPAISLVEELGG